MDWNKYNKLIETANDFFEAAVRCSFFESIKSKKCPLLVPDFTNKAFACELYIKATLYLTKNDLSKGHKLDELFKKLNEKDKKRIYDIWRTVEGQNIEDCNYNEIMFYNNIEANRDVFARFRYVHEWAGTTISLQHSFTSDQMHLHNLSAKKPFGSPPIYDGFLDQFAKSIKKYNNELKIKLINEDLKENFNNQ